MISNPSFLVTACSIAIAFCAECFSPVASAASLPLLHGEGARVVNEKGEPVVLRGCNLGNWLLIEAWMLGWDIEDQETMIRVLAERFGPTESNRLMTLYRDGFITARDFELIKSFGFNVIRLPFDSRMLIDADGKLRPDAFKWIDRGLDLAEQAGVYVILDMHGAPGGQSKQDHTGLRDQNKLWDNPKLQQQMIDLWKTLAERYKGRSVIAAYDVLNEPYGDFQSDMRPALRELIPRVYQSIRAAGDGHLVIFPNTLGSGITFYGDLKPNDYTQIAFTDHYYAGLFGSPSTVRSHAGMFGRLMPETQAYLDRIGAPMLIGEFNVVLDKAGGKPMMRRYYDEFARRGWMATMWSYKLLKPAPGVQSDNWYMVTNAQPLPTIDIRTSSLAEIESYFAQLASMPLAVDEQLREAITSNQPTAMHMPTLDRLPLSTPEARTSGEWTLSDVNSPVASGIAVSEQSVSVVAAGMDIFGTRDSFAFLQQPAPEKVVLTATIEKLADSDTWAKAGLMLRFGDVSSAEYGSAPFVMVNTFTDGSIAFVSRGRVAEVAQESKRVVAPLPCRLAITRDGSRVEAYTQASNGEWVKVGSVLIDTSAPARIGLVTCSHGERTLTEAKFSDFKLVKGSTVPGPVAPHARAEIVASSANLLQDPSFGSAAAEGMATPWNRWGDQAAALGIGGIRMTGEAGVWQDVSTVAGKSYAFAVRVRRAGEPRRGAGISISIEATVDGRQIALADRSVDLADIESEQGWSVLRTEAVAASDKMRVLIRQTGKASGELPAAEINQARVWKLD